MLETGSQTADRQQRVIVLTIGLGAVANTLRSRRFHEQVIIGVIGLAALVSLARENRASALVRLAAWDKRQSLRQQRTAKAALS